MFYLTNKYRFLAHYNSKDVAIWIKLLEDTVRRHENIGIVCDELINAMFITGENFLQSEFCFNKSLRELFGNMCCMECDYWGDLGIDNERIIKTFNNCTSIQKFQIQMCWEIFWGSGDFVKKYLNSEIGLNYFNDDLYSTISMSEFTPFYLSALKDSIDTNVELFPTTIVNIIIHAFNFIIDYRTQNNIQNSQIIEPLWLNHKDAMIKENVTFFKTSSSELIYENTQMYYLIPNCLLDEF
jgi:hypothetical protein